MQKNFVKCNNRMRHIDYISIGLVGLACLLCIGVMLLRMYAPLSFRESRNLQGRVVLADPMTIAYPEDGIDPNSADAEILCLLPGVGEKTAQAFIDEREANGPFVFPEDLLAVKGIGEKKLSNILPLIRLN